MKCIDPTTMSRDERRAELAELLAAGVQRFLAHGIKQPQNLRDQLDVVGVVEAPCGPAAEHSK